MKKSFTSIVLLAGLVLSACQTTSGPAAGSPMRLAGAALPPTGFVDFCKRYPADCVKSSDGAGPVVLDSRRWEQLRRVNAEVNGAIRYVGDDRAADGPGERWEYPSAAGDCEDFALEKRRRLVGAGWPERDLLIAIAQVPGSVAHAVLVAVTSAGDFVLDVRDARVHRWEDVGYRWLKRQSPDNPRIWMNIRNV